MEFLEFLVSIVLGVFILFNIGMALMAVSGDENMTDMLTGDLYCFILFLPANIIRYILLGLIGFFKYLITETKVFSPVKMFHKFMSQKPADLIKFRIKLERK